MEDKKTALIVELVKQLTDLVHSIEPKWQNAYFRFSFQEIGSRTTGSYRAGDAIWLISSIKFHEQITGLSERAKKIIVLLEKERAVLLMILDSAFDYEVKFEYTNMDRWQISKLDGGTGFPEEITLSS